MDRIVGLEAFVAVVNTGSFSKAGQQLGLNKALISKRVATLEKMLNTQLLHRNTRQVCVTATGLLFFEHCENILNEFSKATHLLSQQQVEPEGIIRLNAPMSFGHSHLAPLLLQFMQKYPRIILQLSLSDRFENVVAEGYDLVLRIGELNDSSLIAKPITRIQRILCAAPKYLKHGDRLKQPNDLLKHRILQYGLQKTKLRWYLCGQYGEESVDVQPVLYADNAEFLVEAAIAGQGIISMPEFIVQHALDSKQLIRILPDYSTGALDVNIIWPAHKLLPSRVRLLIDFLVEHLKK